MAERGAEILEGLRQAGVGRGDLVGLVVAAASDGALAAGSWSATTGPDGIASLARLDRELRPRWVVWSAAETAGRLANGGLRVATCWDIGAVHRLLFGGWRAEPARVWALLQGLPIELLPASGPPDLFSHADHDDGDEEDPVRPDGYLRPAWLDGGWAATPTRQLRWAALALSVAERQRRRLADLVDRPMAPAVARSESTAELLCTELAADGLPFDRGRAEEILTAFLGPRPRSEADVTEARARRDGEVLRHVPPGVEVDLRSPAQVKALLGRLGITLPDTRAWRLRELRGTNPLIDALLEWRKAERVATTYGFGWLDEHLGDDGRLRGAWTGCDGAAGRMTASAGLHNMPAELRPAVVAEPGHVFVRADLGQIEPRVLASVSGDAALARASGAVDMYAPVAAQLGVDRPTAKVAVLGAMYGQTTGHGAQALKRLKAAYPVAMRYLDEADRAGQGGRDLRTYGGRLIALGAGASPAGRAEAAGRAAARGRYGRNALVQGAAAELFKMWAVTVRARSEALGARIVLCLHDELLVQVPAGHGPATAELLDSCLQEAATRWAPGTAVRFIAETSVISCWADAKG